MQEEPSEEIYSAWKPPTPEQKPAESANATETPPKKESSPTIEPPRRQSVEETLRQIRYAQAEIRQHQAGRDVAIASSERGGDPGDPGDPNKRDDKDLKKPNAIPPPPRRTPVSQMSRPRNVPPPPSRRPLPERAQAQAPQTPQRPPDYYKGFRGAFRALRDTLRKTSGDVLKTTEAPPPGPTVTVKTSENLAMPFEPRGARRPQTSEQKGGTKT